MAVLIFHGQDEFLVSEIARLMSQRLKGERMTVENEEDWSDLRFRQEGLFDQGQKRVLIFKNQLRSKNQKLLEGLRRWIKEDNLVFVEVVPKKATFYCPTFLKKEARFYDVDKLARQYTFWKKIAYKVGTDLSYDEFREAMSILGPHLALLWTVIQQKALAGKPIKELLRDWTWGDIFRFLESFHRGAPTNIFKEIRLLYLNGVDAYKVWYTLVSEFVRLYQLKHGLQLDLHRFVQQKLKERLSLYETAELETILQQMFDLDLKLKTGYFGRASGKKEGGWEVILSFVFWWFSVFWPQKQRKHLATG